MAKYHVSRSGKAVLCRAKNNCPLGYSYGSLTETKAAAVVIDEYKEIKATEPAITKDLKDLADNEDIEMVGLKHRLKSKEGTVEKIVKREKAKSAKDLYDVVRYTMQVETKDYYNKKEIILSNLKEQGYEIVKEKDTWKYPGYKGINIKMRTKEGYNFELQFHTKESLEAKELAHKLYEKQRLPETPEKEKESLAREMDKIFNEVPIPIKNI